MNFRSDFSINVFLSVLFLVSSLFLFGCTQECAALEYFNTSLEVGIDERSYIGLNTNTDSLAFGKVSPGAVVRRVVDLEYEHKAKVLIVAEADFSSWIEISPNNFLIQPSEKKEVTFVVTVPDEAVSGNYSGRVGFCFIE